MKATTINAASTMQEVLAAYPGTQRALFQRFHIGGCNSCGDEAGDILGEVARGHKIKDLDALIEFIEQAEPADRRMQMRPVDVAVAPIPRYEMGPDPTSDGTTPRLLRSVVSQEAGCRSNSAGKNTLGSRP